MGYAAPMLVAARPLLLDLGPLAVRSMLSWRSQRFLTMAGTPLRVAAGEIVLMPANQPHAVHACTRFKMLLTMIRSV
jgi:hypothetical protein